MFIKTEYNEFNQECFTATKEAYEKFSSKYAEMWEWNPETEREILKYNIRPFCNYCKKGGEVLILGCGTGRDYQLLAKEGYSCTGVDYSSSMLEEAKDRTNGRFIQADIREFDIDKEKYDGVYCESIFTHLSRQDAVLVLSRVKKSLKEKGALYIAVKIGNSGIYFTNDIGGIRYFTVYEKEDFLELISSVGFNVVYSMISEHTEKDRPRWFSLVAKKTK